MRFAGYAALFGVRDAGGDVIRPGAFARSLGEQRQPIPLFWQHRPDQRIGWVERIAEDHKGLRVIACIDNSDGGAGAALRQGKANGLSFGYRAREYARDPQGRVLNDIQLLEVSLVTHPMQHGARVHLTDRASERLLEQKFNPYHDADDGRFTFGPGGGSLARRSSAHPPSSAKPRTMSLEKPRTPVISAAPRISSNSHSPTASNSRTGPNSRNDGIRSRPDTNIESSRWTFGAARSERLDISRVPRKQHLDLTSSDSAASFAMRQVGAGTYRQMEANRHAVGRSVPITRGIGSPRCNAMVYDSLNWAGIAPSRMQGGRIPVANEWGNAKTDIGFYPVITKFDVPRAGVNTHIVSQLREGDVISDGVHVALVTLRFGFPQSVSAVTAWGPERGLSSDLPLLGGVVRNDWGFRPGQKIVVRRFDRLHRSKWWGRF